MTPLAYRNVSSISSFSLNHNCYELSILENYEKGLPISCFYGNTIANEKGGPFYESYYDTGKRIAENHNTP